MSVPRIDIHALATHEEFSEAVRLQQEIWGFAADRALPMSTVLFGNPVFRKN